MAVVVDQAGLDREHLQPVPDRLLGVIGPVGRRPAGQPAQLLLAGLDAEHGVQGRAQVDQAPVQGLGLVDGPREPVHEPASQSSRPAAPSPWR